MITPTLEMTALSSSSCHPSRVLFVVKRLWGGNGITSHLKTLALELAKYNVEVAIVSDIASIDSDAYEQAMIAVDDFKLQGVKYYIIPFSDGFGFANVKRTFASLSDLDNVIKDFQPTIVHLHSLSVLPYIHLVSLKYKIPFVSTCHQKPIPSQAKSKVIQFAHKFFHRLLGDHFIAVSSDVQKIFQESLKIPSNNITCICHGVDSHYFRNPSPDERKAARHGFGIGKNENVVCLIGRLAPEKGHHILIDAMSILEQEGVSLTALFAGKDYLDEMQQVKNCAHHCGLTHKVIYLGMTDSQTVLWASDILVLPSQSEAFGLVIPEAMLSGVVPIRTPSGGSSDQIKHGVNGFLVPFEDPISLAEKLRFLINSNDERDRMAKNAIYYAKERFTVEAMSEATFNVYKKVLGSWVGGNSLKS